MKTLPELNEDAIIELAREGGFAFIPKLAGLRRFALASVTSSERERICNAIRNAFPQARDPGEPDGPARRPVLLPHPHQLSSPAAESVCRCCPADP